MVLHELMNRYVVETVAGVSSPSQTEIPTIPTMEVGEQPKGVFVMKSGRVHEVQKTICLLDKFFNKGPKYAIRIFADEIVSETTMEELRRINPLVDIQVIVDEEKWKQLPDELSPDERAEIEARCTISSCTTAKCPMGYVYMGYWRYRRMAYEESLKDFEYFISIDGDAYLTKPWDVDPFRLLQGHNLTGFYVTDLQNYKFDQGIEETARIVFGNSTEGRGYLDSPQTFPLFNDGEFNHRSFYGYLYGGRLDFFRLPEFREFSRQMVPYTYRHRVDEQVVIAVAWGMIAPDRVWHLPSRGHRLGVYHHSFVDETILVNCNANQPPPGATFFNDTTTGLCYWKNPGLTGSKPLTFQYPGWFWARENWFEHDNLVRSLLVSDEVDNATASQIAASNWEKCLCQPTKGTDSTNQCKEEMKQ